MVIRKQMWSTLTNLLRDNPKKKKKLELSFFVFVFVVFFVLGFWTS